MPADKTSVCTGLSTTFHPEAGCFAAGKDYASVAVFSTDFMFSARIKHRDKIYSEASRVIES